MKKKHILMLCALFMNTYCRWKLLSFHIHEAFTNVHWLHYASIKDAVTNARPLVKRHLWSANTQQDWRAPLHVCTSTLVQTADGALLISSSTLKHTFWMQQQPPSMGNYHFFSFDSNQRNVKKKIVWGVAQLAEYLLK